MTMTAEQDLFDSATATSSKGGGAVFDAGESLNKRPSMSCAEFLRAKGYRPEIWDWNIGEQHFDSWSPTYVKPKRVWSELSSSDKPILIFAPRGVGKSALRVMMQKHLETAKKYFVIEHVTMDPILRRGSEPLVQQAAIPVSAHLGAIVEQAILKLVAHIVAQDEIPNVSTQTARILCRLWELHHKPHITEDWDSSKRARWNRFAGPWWRHPLRTLRRAVGWTGTRLQKSSGETDAGAVLKALGELLSPNEDENAKRLLDRLSRVVRELGFEKIVVAVNGLDEHPETHDLRKVDQIGRILEPLLMNQQLLEMDGYLWRIFVPWHAKGSSAVHTFRGSNIDPRNLRMDLEWTADEMLCILGSRLLAFRTSVEPGSLKPIEDPKAALSEVERLVGPRIAKSELMTSIITMAHCNPRRLFSLMESITTCIASTNCTSKTIDAAVDVWADGVFDQLPESERRILIRYREAKKVTMTAAELAISSPADAPDLQLLVVKNQLQKTTGKTESEDNYMIVDPALKRWFERALHKSA